MRGLTKKLSEKEGAMLLVDICKKGKYKTGVSCLFHPLSKKVGVKIFHDKENRDNSHKRQSRAEKVGLGPKTGSKFKIRYYDFNIDGDHTVYGYLTEKVRTNISSCIMRRNKLKDLLREAKLDMDDIHNENVGYKNGKMVLIDFDDASYYR